MFLTLPQMINLYTNNKQQIHNYFKHHKINIHENFKKITPFNDSTLTKKNDNF